MKIHGGDKTKIKGDALNKMEIPPNQDESGGMPQTRWQWGDAPNVNDSGGMPQT